MSPHPSNALAAAPVLATSSRSAPVTPVGRSTRGIPGADEQARLRAGLGAALRRERTAHRLSQQALAAISGCNRRTVERLESGQLRPTTALIAALSHALAVPPGWSPAGRREAVDRLAAELAAAAGPSLVESTPGGARRRRRRLQRARRAASRACAEQLQAVDAARQQETAVLLAHAEKVNMEARRCL